MNCSHGKARALQTGLAGTFVCNLPEAVLGQEESEQRTSRPDAILAPLYWLRATYPELSQVP